jgi:hypothetical protein
MSARARVSAVAVALVVGAVLGGCSEEAPGSEMVSNPRLDGSATATPPDPDDASTPTSSPAPRAPSATVTVDAVLQTEGSAPVQAFIAFVRAHAESVNTGYATTELSQVATAAEHARQVDVIDWAASQGYAVPDRPRVAVLASSTDAAGQVILDVCLWLPSTEFVSRVSGLPVDAEVPDTWRPASATLTRHNDGWRVARLADAHRQHPISCGGLT